jgi:hypothetical protein
MGSSLEIGRSELLFGSLASVCEDTEKNFYVLDRMEFRVLKFSPDGRLLLKFGQKGQGPGDFQSPNRIVFTSQGELAVLEDLYYVSFLKADGTFIRRLDLNGRLDLGYIGPDRFYGWIWRPADKQQVMVDAGNSVIATFHEELREQFSVSMPDETGRGVMFNYSHNAYGPHFLFSHQGSWSAVGISSLYSIALLDDDGKIVATIQRQVKPEKISNKEKALFEREIREIAKTRGWPERPVRELLRKVPASKNPVCDVRISPEYVFVFRFPPDITQNDAPLPVDIFTTRGRFLGTAELPDIPIFISERAMYFARSDVGGNIYLVKTDYSLSRD